MSEAHNGEAAAAAAAARLQTKASMLLTQPLAGSVEVVRGGNDAISNIRQRLFARSLARSLARSAPGYTISRQILISALISTVPHPSY